ncbi:hypothetical protein ACE6H2_010414 [Prunus campanulata]
MFEAEAALSGLKLAAQFGHQKVILEYDSKVLVDGLNGRMGNRAWTILPIINDIRGMRHPHCLFDVNKNTSTTSLSTNNLFVHLLLYIFHGVS